MIYFIHENTINWIASNQEELDMRLSASPEFKDKEFFEIEDNILNYKIVDSKIVKKTSDDLLQEKLAEARAKKLQALADYDSSPAVNIFTINGISLWLPKELRTALKNRAESILSLYNQGLITSKVMEIEVIQGVFISLDADAVLFMLNKIEYYAGECYMVTSKHAVAINELANTPNITIEKILSYNFEKGYPDKLNF